MNEATPARKKRKVYDPVKNPVTQKELREVIEILKTATSTFVKIDCIRYPIRDLIGDSRGDLRMGQLRQDLERLGIMKNSLGIFSNCETPAFYYMETMILEDEWFEKHCIRGKIDR